MVGFLKFLIGLELAHHQSMGITPKDYLTWHFHHYSQQVRQIGFNFHIHEYAKHLLRYHDNRFGRYPPFRYFLPNIIMRHRAQSSSVVFVKKNMTDLLTTMEELREHLKNIPESWLVEMVMRFWNYTKRYTWILEKMSCWSLWLDSLTWFKRLDVQQYYSH